MSKKEEICPLCQGKIFSPYPRFNLTKCASCNLIVSTSVWFEQSNLELEKEWFEEEYVNSSSFWVRIFEGLNNRRTWKRISPFAANGNKLLEIGVGSGSFLDYVRNKKLNVMGCDLSKAICQDIQKRLKIPMFNGFIANLPKNNQYDLVVMNHVFEHVNDPIEFLKTIRSRMGEKGILHIVVPNVGSWEALIPGWTSYEPYHLIYFTPGTLHQTLEKAGFKVFQLTTHESFSGWFLTIIRTLLKIQGNSASQRQINRRERKTSWIEHFYRLAMVLTGIITFPLRYIQAKMGFGDEIAILAVPALDGGHKNEN